MWYTITPYDKVWKEGTDSNLQIYRKFVNYSYCYTQHKELSICDSIECIYPMSKLGKMQLLFVKRMKQVNFNIKNC